MVAVVIAETDESDAGFLSDIETYGHRYDTMIVGTTIAVVVADSIRLARC